MAAREFDGTFDVKPQVYGTYGNESDYPPPQPARERDGQRDYQAVDYRDHPDYRARYQPPARVEREGGYRPPPRDRDYFPPPHEEHEHGYRRDYPPRREPPPPERGYDYRQPPPRAPPYDRERDRDYDRGPPPPPARSERMYEPPPHEREYPPPLHYRGRSPPPMGVGYEHQTREREGKDKKLYVFRHHLSILLYKLIGVQYYFRISSNVYYLYTCTLVIINFYIVLQGQTPIMVLLVAEGLEWLWWQRG